MQSKEVLIIEEIKTKERVYQFIVKYISDNGYAPSVREICKGVNLSSTSSVYAHLVRLETERRIKTKPYSPRAIKVEEETNAECDRLNSTQTSEVQKHE